jgi:hypothetical protein
MVYGQHEEFTPPRKFIAGHYSLFQLRTNLGHPLLLPGSLAKAPAVLRKKDVGHLPNALGRCKP